MKQALNMLKRACLELLLLCLLPVAVGQTVSGTITDESTGETLIGATVFDSVSGKGTVTNAHGRYSLTTGRRDMRLRVSYVGYATQAISLHLDADRTLNLALSSAVELRAVEVTAERVGGVKVSQMSAVELPVEQIKLVPVIFGEADVLKAIQLLPGVQSGTEGMSGIYVRGGGPDQNLFLLDGIPLYNVNHLGGFFSAFNGDAIKNVTLYKGSFPSQFSGRISSVLDITTNNGHDREWHGNASLGLIAAKVSVEGPIVKERTTVSLSLRRTYGDLLILPLVKAVALSEGVRGASAGYYFYDLNAKLTHRFSDRSRLYATFYSGDDVAHVGFKETYDVGNNYKMKLGYNWGNLASAVRWNYELTPRLFMNLTGSYTRYRQKLSAGVEEEEFYMGASYQNEVEMSVRSGIRDLSARADFDYAPTPDHAVKFGALFTNHVFTPEVQATHLQTVGEPTLDTTFGEQRTWAQEMSLYAGDDWSITNSLKVNAGLVAAGFLVGGRFYPSLQPRLSSRLMLTRDLSVKAGYSYMTQYMHLLSTSNISLPTDLWVPVTKRIEPMSSQQVAVGLFYDLRGLVDLSVEGYYKWMDNLLEYKPGSSFFGASAGWEDKVCMGRGWAYGVEFLAQRTVGQITGWVGYTWSRTMRLFDVPGEELNGGKPFPAKYDRIHDISITLQYRPDDRFDIGLTWVYSTGNTATIAMQQIESDGDYYWSQGIQYVESRNNFRLPAYHRMDVSANFHKKKKHGVRTWSVSVYNLYNRQNPFIVYPKTSAHDDFYGTTYSTTLMQRSLFPILPSVSYIYKF